MKPTTITVQFILLAAFLIAAFDTYQYDQHGYAATISGVWKDWSDDAWWLKYLLAGALVFLWGHLTLGWGVIGK